MIKTTRLTDPVLQEYLEYIDDEEDDMPATFNVEEQYIPFSCVAVDRHVRALSFPEIKRIADSVDGRRGGETNEDWGARRGRAVIRYMERNRDSEE